MGDQGGGAGWGQRDSLQITSTYLTWDILTEKQLLYISQLAFTVSAVPSALYVTKETTGQDCYLQTGWGAIFTELIAGPGISQVLSICQLHCQEMNHYPLLGVWEACQLSSFASRKIASILSKFTLKTGWDAELIGERLIWLRPATKGSDLWNITCRHNSQSEVLCKSGCIRHMEDY